MRGEWALNTKGCLQYWEGKAFIDGVSIEEIVQRVGTPCYIYSANGFRETARRFKKETCGENIQYKYAIKANSNLEVIKILMNEGFGADIVSIGEMKAALAAGMPPKEIVFAGVGKNRVELKEAIQAGIGYISAESTWEIMQLFEIGKTVQSDTRIIVRININVDGATHPYLTTGREENKFGIDSRVVMQNYVEWQRLGTMPIDGIQVHIGSQITDINAFSDAAEETIQFVQQLRQIGGHVHQVDFGGGVGISYDGKSAFDLSRYGSIVRRMRDELNVEVVLEPGRYLVAENGVIAGTVLYHKEGVNKDFLIQDIGMNDLIRPALYQAFHDIIPVYEGHRNMCRKKVDIVGPICESGDFMATGRDFLVLEPGDRIVVASAGAYGYAMASNYNMRGKPPEVMIDQGTMRVIRARESIDKLIGSSHSI